MPLDGNDKYNVEKKICKAYIASYAKIKLVEHKLDEVTKLSIIGQQSDAISSGKFVAIDTTKVYLTSSSIVANNIGGKWFYYNSATNLNILTELTQNDVDFLTDNLNQSLTIYIDPYEITTFRNQIMSKNILYYKNIINTNVDIPLNVTFINNSLNNLYYLWSYEHKPNKYFINSGKYLFIGPNISLDTYDFMEANANNPLIKIINNTDQNVYTNVLKLSVESNNSEFFVKTINGFQYIMSKVNVLYNDYTNKKIKIKLIIDDGNYVYQRVFFITISKMVYNSTDFTAIFGIKPTGDTKFIADMFDILIQGKQIQESDYIKALTTVTSSDNCKLMQQLEILRDTIQTTPSLATTAQKITNTITSFRSAQTMSDYKSFISTAYDAISTASTTVLATSPQVTTGLNATVSKLEEFLKILERLKLIPTVSIPYAISTYKQITKDLLITSQAYTIVRNSTITGLKAVNAQLSNTYVNTLPSSFIVEADLNTYSIPVNFYDYGLTYAIYFKSNLMSSNGISIGNYEQLIVLRNGQYNHFAYVAIRKTATTIFNLEITYGPTSGHWKNSAGDTNALTLYTLPDVSTLYYLKFEIIYNKDNNRTYLKISNGSTVILNVYSTYTDYSVLSVKKRYL